VWIACERRGIKQDLTESWKDALITNDFDSHQRSVWLIEGCLFCQSDDTITQLIDEITSLSAPGSWLGFDIINSAVLTSPWTKQWVGMQAQYGAPWIGTMDDSEGFLTARGWKVTLTQYGQPDANFSRWVLPVIPTNAPGLPHNWFVTAQEE